MELLKQLVDKDIENFETAKRNSKINPYDFLKALSRASAYLKLKGKEGLSDKQKEIASLLWKGLVWDSMTEAMSIIKRGDYSDKEEWVKQVRKKYSLTKKAYLDEMIKFMDDMESIVMAFRNLFMVEEAQRREAKPISYDDIKLKYSIGILVRK